MSSVRPRPLPLLRRLRLHVPALVLLLAVGSAHGQAQHFRQYTGVDGLPQAQVQVIHQDPLGFVWAGTFGGLGRFDGRNFSQFSTADGLSSNTIQALASEPDGSLWAGQSSGLCVLRPGQVRFECPALPGIADGNVRALLMTPDVLWVGTRDGLYALRRAAKGGYEARRAMTGNVATLARAGTGLWVGGTGGLWILPADGRPRPIALPRTGVEVQALQVDGSRLWIGTKSGLLVRQGASVSIPQGMAAPLRALDVTGLALGPDGLLWATTRHGLLHQRSDGFELLRRGDGLSDENLAGVIRDREGNVWIGGDGGLTSYMDAGFVGYDEHNGLWRSFVRAMAEDAKGRLWLGGREGVQVVRVDGAGRIHEQFRIDRSDGLVDDRIYGIRFDPSGQAWLSTGHGLAVWREGRGIVHLYTKADGLPDNGVRAVHPLHDGALAIATNGGVAVMRDGRIGPAPQPELAQAQVIHISEDRTGRLWFGSLQKGVFALDRDGRVEHLSAANGLSDQTVWQTAPDADGGIWIGTNGDGLFHRDRAGRLRRYTTHDGLVDNFIWQVLVDRGGDVWAFTNRGLSRFDGRDFSNFGIDDGLLDQEGAATSTLQTSTGVRWFASGQGLMRYVDNGREAALLAPVAAISTVLSGGQPLAPGAVLGPRARNFEFRFAAPLFRRNSDLLYRYRLRGAGDEWTELRSDHPVSYANLGAGHYAFEVQARRTSQPWPRTAATFGFRVQPPLWRTPLFLIALGLALAAAAWMAARLRLRTIEAGRRALELLVRERTEALEDANRQLEHASFTDPLTELRNRRYMANQVDIDIAQVSRAYADPAPQPNRDMIFLMVDIDHFKRINDTHGHAAGDRVLREYARLIGSVIRDSDYAVRWGGEEFLLVARQADSTLSEALAERLVDCVRTTDFVIDDAGTVIRSTCSVGLSHFPFLGDAPHALAWQQVIDICDVAVYLAKAGGRDGWVALHGVSGHPIPDAREFMQRIKCDPVSLAREGAIRLTGTRCPQSASGDAPRPSHAT